MNIKKILGWIMKTPLILLVLLTAGVGFYAASGMLPGFTISYASPLLLTGLIVLYMLGSFLASRDKKIESEPTSDYLEPSNSDYDEETNRALAEYNE
jgi:hypothetical protein